jgi:hypothetical protein
MNQDDRKLLERARSSLMLLAFGLGILGFLVMIDHPEWFELRPVSGTASAMAKAGNTADRSDNP